MLKVIKFNVQCLILIYKIMEKNMQVKWWKNLFWYEKNLYIGNIYEV